MTYVINSWEVSVCQAEMERDLWVLEDIPDEGSGVVQYQINSMRVWASGWAADAALDAETDTVLFQPLKPGYLKKCFKNKRSFSKDG